MVDCGYFLIGKRAVIPNVTASMKHISCSVVQLGQEAPGSARLHWIHWNNKGQHITLAESFFGRRKMELNWIKHQLLKQAAASRNVLNYFQKCKSERGGNQQPSVFWLKNTRRTITVQSISICLTELCPWEVYSKNQLSVKHLSHWEITVVFISPGVWHWCSGLKQSWITIAFQRQMHLG